jgi:hypothetical protein
LALVSRRRLEVIVNHEEGFVEPITGCCTNTIIGTWNGIKLRIPARHRTKVCVLCACCFLLEKKIRTHVLEETYDCDEKY